MITFENLIKTVSDDNILENMLKGEVKVNGKKAGLADALGTEFASMKDYDQNSPYHCYDLLRHTVETVKSLKKKEFGSRTEAWVNLRIAALFHDIGKPAVRKEKGEKSVYGGHAEKSAEIAGGIFDAMGLEDKVRKERILFFIAHHDDFLGIDEPGTEKGKARVLEIISKEITGRIEAGRCFVPGCEDYKDLIKLCKADDNAKKDEITDADGNIIDSKEMKARRTDTVLRLIKENEDDIPEATGNSIFICIPFTLNGGISEKKDFERVAKDLNSDKFEGIDACNDKILRFAAGRFNCTAGRDISENDGTVCLARKLKNVDFDLPGMHIDGSTELFVDAGNRFRLESLCVFCFYSGVNILVEQIAFEHNDFRKISDSLFVLHDTRNQVKVKADGAGIDFHNSILRGIFPDGNPSIITAYSNLRKSQYVNIVSYFRCSKGYYERYGEEMLFRLSHCYKSDIKYEPDSDDKTEKYVNNNNCVWGISPYGNTCIAFQNDYTKSFFRNVKSGYLLIYAILLNQKYTLYRYLERIPGELSDVEKAKDVRENLYKFEMNCNLKTISELPQYQNVYRLTYKAFNIDNLMSDISEPLDAYDAILQRKEKENEEKRREEEERREKKELEDEEKRDKKLNRALGAISILTISSALIDLWSFIGECFGLVNGIKGHMTQLALCIVIFVIWLICVVPLIKDWIRNWIETRFGNKKTENHNENQ